MSFITASEIAGKKGCGLKQNQQISAEEHFGNSYFSLISCSSIRKLEEEV